MASKPKAAALDIVENVVLAPVAEIEFGDRLRPIDDTWAQALGQIMLTEGQKTPIEICRLPGKKGWTLVAGGHRLAGAVHAGLAYIKAIEVDANAIDRRMREVSENLWRKGLEPLERAAFIAELHQLLRARAGVAADASAQSIAANARWQKQVQAEAEDASANIALAYGWTDQLVEQVGLSRRTLFNDLALHRRLAPDVIARLRPLPIARNASQLKALAKLSDRDQRKVADMIVTGDARDVSAAITQLQNKPAVDPAAKRLSAFIGSFQRMGVAEKRAALAELATMLPAGITLDLGGAAR